MPRPSSADVAPVVGAAIIRNGRLLAARRVGGRFAGLWEFPGGKVEPGESDHEALRRELREELGVTGTIGGQVGGAWPLDAGHTMHVYLVTLADGQEPRCLEGCDALRWVGASEAPSLSWITADLPIVAAVQGFLRDPRPLGGRPPDQLE
jgi:8-oxo-dGTP diphosphatase